MAHLNQALETRVTHREKNMQITTTLTLTAEEKAEISAILGCDVADLNARLN